MFSVDDLTALTAGSSVPVALSVSTTDAATQSSTVPITSGGVYNLISDLNGVSGNVQQQINGTREDVYGTPVNTTITLGDSSYTTVKSAIGAVHTLVTAIDDTVDSALDGSSTRPVQNGVIVTALGNKQDSLTFDSVPSNASANSLTSGAIYTALASKADASSLSSYQTSLSAVATSGDYGDLINTPSIPAVGGIDTSSVNVPSSNAVYTALGNKQDSLTFDSVPSNASANSLTSGAIYTALASKADASLLSSYQTSLSAVATSGDYGDLSNKPSIPAVGGIDTSSVNVPSSNAVNTALNSKLDDENPAIVAGNEADDKFISIGFGNWLHKIKFFAMTANNSSNNYIKLSPISTEGYQTDVLTVDGAGKCTITGDLDVSGSVTIPDATIDYNTKLTNIPTFSSVATSGSFTDLTNKPSIPSTISYQLDNLGTYQLSASVLHDMNASSTVYNFSGTVNNNLISHTAHTEIFTINQDGWYIITVLLMSRDGASNNRSLILGLCKVITSFDTVRNTYMLGNCYYRDDNNTHDDCVINNTITVYLKQSESFKIQTVRSYTESPTGAIHCTVSESYIDIQYAAAVLS